MLREISSGKYPDKGNRRWFSDEYFDLIVWLELNSTIRGIQLCYDKRGTERALTWQRGRGFSHERVDAGETDPEKNRSPILIPDGPCASNDLQDRFLTDSLEIDGDVRDFVLTKLAEYGAGVKN